MKTLLPWKDSKFAAKTRQEKFLAVFPWVWLVAAYCGTLAFQWCRLRGYLDSDSSSEMVLANLLNEEGGLLSTNWWYSSELRVFYLQIFYRLGLYLFPQDWYSARMFGQALWMALLIIAYLYVGHALRLRGNGVWGAAALACPFGMWVFRYGWYGGFYVPHMILVLFSLGLALQLLYRAPLWRRAVRWLALLAVCLISGLNGIKGIMGLYLPQCAAAVLLLLHTWRKTPEHCPMDRVRYLGISIISLLAAGVGYRINGTVLAANHSFASYNNSTWGKLDLTQLLRCWADLLSLFGYPCDSYYSLSVPLLSVRGILGTFGYLLAILFVVFLVISLRRLDAMPAVQQILPVLAASICVVQGSICAFTGGTIGLNATYWLTVMPICLTVYVQGVEWAEFRLPHAKQIAAVGLLLCVGATSVSTIWTHVVAESGRPYIKTICDELLAEGYTQGYATFWYANAMTEWTSGQMEMWVTEDFSTMETYEWLQEKSHADPPQGRIFLFANRNEETFNAISALPEKANVIFDDGTFYVFSFESYEEMIGMIQTSQQE